MCKAQNIVDWAEICLEMLPLPVTVHWPIKLRCMSTNVTLCMTLLCYVQQDLHIGHIGYIVCTAAYSKQDSWCAHGILIDTWMNP